MIPRDLLSAFPHRQFHTLPGRLDSWAALPNSYPNALRAMQGGSLYYFYDGLWYDPVKKRTHDLPCESRTRYRLSQPDKVSLINWTIDWNDTKLIYFHYLGYADSVNNIKKHLIQENRVSTICMAAILDWQIFC